MKFIELLKQCFNVVVRDENDIVENRGAQISYSVIGFHESIDKKYGFDPDESKRRSALKALEKQREVLGTAGIEVTPAGTTVYNFIKTGKHKGFNVARLLKYKEWRAEECLYIGDALFPGGNDETVIGIIPTQAVNGPENTFELIAKMLG